MGKMKYISLVALFNYHGDVTLYNLKVQLDLKLIPQCINNMFETKPATSRGTKAKVEIAKSPIDSQKHKKTSS